MIPATRSWRFHTALVASTSAIACLITSLRVDRLGVQFPLRVDRDRLEDVVETAEPLADRSLPAVEQLLARRVSAPAWGRAS